MHDSPTVSGAAVSSVGNPGRLNFKLLIADDQKKVVWNMVIEIRNAGNIARTNPRVGVWADNPLRNIAGDGSPWIRHRKLVEDFFRLR